MFKLTIAYLLLLGLLSCVNTAAANASLAVTQQWLEDPAQTYTPNEALTRFNSGSGKLIDEPVFRLGNNLNKIWLLITVSNRGDQDQSIRLLAGAPYSKHLHARLLQVDQVAGTGKTLIDERETRTFGERNNRFRLLNSNAFSLDVGETREILINTLVEGPSYLPFSILSVEQFHELQLDDSIFASLFYGFTLTLGVLFLLFSLAVKHRIALLYAALFLLGLIIVADIDGYAFKWLWPDYPKWNHFSPLLILPLLNCLGFVIVHQLLTSVGANKFQWLKTVSVALAIFSLTLPLSLTVLSFSTVIQIENMLSIPAFILQPIAFISWLHLGRRSYASLAAVFMIAFLVIMMIASIFIDISLPDWILEHLHHTAYLIVGILVMGIITVQLMGLHKDQQSTLQRELALAQENARINQSLLTAEQNYSKAQRLASQHQQQLASATHDLRQPIVSLRASIDAISVNQSSAVREQLRDAFDYIESLCGQYLSQSRPAGSSSIKTKKESYPASLILGTVQRMFANEASARGVELRKVNCSIALTTDPMVLMRIVSNLVANAIKHHSKADKAKVLLGCRRSGSKLLILVCDNGSGMTTEELDKLQQAYQKCTNSDGEGLGLAIINQLARRHGMTIECESQVGKGSCFNVGVKLI